MNIRDEIDTDHKTVFKINVSAFETDAEATLVDKLREQVQSCISLVAEEAGTVIGHIMFTPVTLTEHPELKIIGLAPMAVLPDKQNSGVGSKLVYAGLTKCRALDFAAIVVLGHPKFYPHFGFEPSSNFGIDSEYNVPAEVFMAMELKKDALKHKSGRINYHRAFNEL